MFQWSRRLAIEKPYLFCLFALIAPMLAGGVGVLAGMLLTGDPMIDMLPQRGGKIAGWLFCLLILWRWDALAESGVSRLGGPRLWLLTAVVAFYLAGAYSWSFFGQFLFSFPATSLARSTAVQELATGLFEEFAFRGLLFYGLMLAWGRERNGALKAALVSALLFGLLHLVYLAAGFSLDAVLNSIIAIISGFWYAAMVYRFKSIWPAVLLHGLINALVLANSAAYPTMPNAYFRALLFELPLTAMAFFWLRREEVAFWHHKTAA